MKKIIVTLAVLAGITATAQVKVGNNVNTLRNATSNFEVEGTTIAEQFVILKNGNVGIGTITPNAQFAVVSENQDWGRVAITNSVYQGTTQTAHATLALNTSRGTAAAPDFIPVNMALGAFVMDSKVGRSSIYARATENHTATSGASNLEFAVTPSGSAQPIMNALTINSNSTLKLEVAPTITTATKVLVRDASNIISEQVVNGNTVNTVATPSALPVIQNTVGGNIKCATADAGLMLKSADGSDWLVTMGNGGVMTITKQ